jgi:hypothetical protein
MEYMDRQTPSKEYIMEVRNYCLGITGNFLADLIVKQHCTPEYPIFESCIDATDYVPTGVHSDQSGVAVANVTYAR